MYGFIYITTNNINGKKYLGMCAYHKPCAPRYLGSGKALLRAIRKYGRENFSREVLLECETKEELASKEVELIKLHDCVADKMWYNVAVGGHITKGFKGKKHSEETREKMRRNHKRPMTEETREKFKKNMLERQATGLLAHNNHARGSKHPRATPVVINGVEYETLSAAMKLLSMSYQQIKNLIRSQAT